jgi:hypothetical protein
LGGHCTCGNPRGFLNKIYTLLKPDGLFVSELHHGSSLFSRHCRDNGADHERLTQGEQHIIYIQWMLIESCIIIESERNTLTEQWIRF